MSDTRTRGIMVYPILSEDICGPENAGTYALLMRDDGEVRMIHSEGVAYAVTADKPWRWNDYYADCPLFTVRELVALAFNSEPVDLADWIRVFGARLESNFHQIVHWYNEARVDGFPDNHLEEECGVSITFGPSHDRYGATCEVVGDHVLRDGQRVHVQQGCPIGGDPDTLFRWLGGGRCAGDPLSFQILKD